MATATATRPTETWEPDLIARCDACLDEASVRHLRAVIVHGVRLDICTVCLLDLVRQHVIDRAIRLRRLARSYAATAA
jgi:hypothetical protein